MFALTCIEVSTAREFLLRVTEANQEPKLAPVSKEFPNWFTGLKSHLHIPWVKFVYNGIRDGFRIGLGSHVPKFVTNVGNYYQSDFQTLAVIDDFVKEISAGRVCRAPKKALSCNTPVFCVEKQESKFGYRIVKDFSCSNSSFTSLNGCLLPEYVSIIRISMTINWVKSHYLG